MKNTAEQTKTIGQRASEIGVSVGANRNIMEKYRLVWDDASNPANPGLMLASANELWRIAPTVNHYDATRPEDLDSDEIETIIAETVAYHQLGRE